MKSLKHFLLLQQIDNRLQPFSKLNTGLVPEKGWIHTVRTALKMSLRQLGNRLNISAQSVKELEKRESNESITLKSLREAGEKLDLTLIYGFIPKHKNLETMIENRARELAEEIISRSEQTIVLDKKGKNDRNKEKSLKLKTLEIKHEMPRYLWD